jgi:hypothetical protein
MRSLGSIGIDILSSHHTLDEEYTYHRFMAAVAGKADAADRALLLAPTEDDPEFAKKLDEALAKLGPNPERGEFAATLTRTLIEVSSHEGDDVYRATASIADPMLRTRHKTFNDDHDDPELFVRPQTPQTEAAYREYWSLQERAFRRVGTATRRWVSLQQKAVAEANTPEQKDALRSVVLKRLLDRQLKMLDDSEARLATYLKDPPQNMPPPSMPRAACRSTWCSLAWSSGFLPSSSAAVATASRRPRSLQGADPTAEENRKLGRGDN